MHEIVDMALGVGNLPEQIWSIIKRAEAAEAEVKRIKQMSLGSIYKEATDRLETAESRVRDLTKALTDALTRCNQHIDDAAAIEAATIERCAEVAESSAMYHNGFKVGTGIALAIRALAKSPTAT